MSPPTAAGLLLCGDLMFGSRITGTARSLGLTVRTMRSPDALLEAARQEAPGGVLVDLAHPGLAITELVEGLRQACTPMPRIVAFGSHVDTATLRSAREAGCDEVLPRSKFVEDLPQRLPQWLSGT